MQALHLDPDLDPDPATQINEDPQPEAPLSLSLCIHVNQFWVQFVILYLVTAIVI